MANTAWNQSDLSGVTLSGSNLIATSTSSSTSTTMHWVRAADAQATGKFYWEVTMTGWAGSNTSPALANKAADLTQWNAPTLLALYNNGNLYLGGGVVASGFTGLTSGAVVCIALDAGAQLAWFRVGASGQWNGSTNGNPATGAGGVSVTAIGGGGPRNLYPAATFTAAEAVTANFGGSAFTGTVPSGFTSGFTAGATSPTSAMVTQAALEQFLTTNPPAQVTQVALEQWTTTSYVWAANGTLGANATLLSAASARFAGAGSLTVVPQPQYVSKLNVYGVLINVAAEVSKLNAYAVLNTVAFVPPPPAAKPQPGGGKKQTKQWGPSGTVFEVRVEKPHKARRRRYAATIAPSAVAWQDGAAFVGAGSLAAQATVIASAGAALSGTGVLGASLSPLDMAGAALAGQGSLSAVAALSLPIYAQFAASGLLRASGAVWTSASAQFAAQGAFGAVASLNVGVQAGFAAQGSLTALLASPGQAGVVLTGVGLMTANLFVATFGNAALAGVGSLSAVASVEAAASAALAGSGSLAAFATTVTTVAASASMNGQGSFTAVASIIGSASAVLIGEGDLSTQGSMTAVAKASFAAQGVMIARGQAFKRGVTARKTTIFGRLQFIDTLRGGVSHSSLAAGSGRKPVAAGRDPFALMAGRNKPKD